MKKYKPRSSCCVADRGCEAPANLEDPPLIKTECFKCGNAVCKNCSSRRKYLNYGIKRLCNDCQVDMDGTEYKVIYRMALQGGYTRLQAKLIAKDKTKHEVPKKKVYSQTLIEVLKEQIINQLLEEDNNHENCPICGEDNTQHDSLCSLGRLAKALE